MLGVDAPAAVVVDVDAPAGHGVDRGVGGRLAVGEQPGRGHRGRRCRGRPACRRSRPRPWASGRCCPCRRSGSRCAECSEQRVGPLGSPGLDRPLRPRPGRETPGERHGRRPRSPHAGADRRRPAEPAGRPGRRGARAGRPDGRGPASGRGRRRRVRRRWPGPTRSGSAAQLSWRYGDPGALVAERVGRRPRQTIYTVMGGNYVQSLVNMTAADIARRPGRRRAHHRRRGLAVAQPGPEPRADRCAWTTQPEGTDPPCRWARTPRCRRRARSSAACSCRSSIYPMFEVALRAAAGRTPDEQRRRGGRALVAVQPGGRHQPQRLDPAGVHRRRDRHRHRRTTG